jgi:hypothetical protein
MEPEASLLYSQDLATFLVLSEKSMLFSLFMFQFNIIVSSVPSYSSGLWHVYYVSNIIIITHMYHLMHMIYIKSHAIHRLELACMFQR